LVFGNSWPITKSQFVSVLADARYTFVTGVFNGS